MGAIFVDPLFLFLIYVQKVWLFSFYLIENHLSYMISSTEIFMLEYFANLLYIFPIHYTQDDKCIAIDWDTRKILVFLRTVNDTVYFLNILLQVIFLEHS